MVRACVRRTHCREGKRDNNGGGMEGHTGHQPGRGARAMPVRRVRANKNRMATNMSVRDRPVLFRSTENI